jgi:hypothetical protein
MMMSELADFFHKEAQECRRLSVQARTKNDREYWLRLAQGWEQLIQPKQGPDPDFRAVRSLRPARPMFSKRRAA